jgi:hypothetical protein
MFFLSPSPCCESSDELAEKVVVKPLVLHPLGHRPFFMKSVTFFPRLVMMAL